MKTFLLLAILLIACRLPAHSGESAIFRAEWLEKGCLAAMVSETDPKSLSKSQSATLDEVTIWMNGFLVGANAMMFAERGGDKDIFVPPMEWLDGRRAAPLLLNFIRSHRDQIKPDAPARVVMLAWYLTAHPKASEYNKFIGENLLKNPGADPARSSERAPGAIPPDRSKR